MRGSAISPPERFLLRQRRDRERVDPEDEVRRAMRSHQHCLHWHLVEPESRKNGKTGGMHIFGVELLHKKSPIEETVFDKIRAVLGATCAGVLLGSI